MSVQIQKFIYEDLDLDVIVDENDNLLFFAEQVTEILGYKNTNQAIRRYVEEEDRVELKDVCDPVVSRGSNKILIKEPGFYSLVFGSKHPQAEKFKNWIVEEVLPPIFTTGKYTEKRV